MIPLNLALASAIKIASGAAVGLAVSDVVNDKVEAIEGNEKDSTPIKVLKAAGIMIIGSVVIGAVVKEFSEAIDVTFRVDQ